METVEIKISWMPPANFNWSNHKQPITQQAVAPGFESFKDSPPLLCMTMPLY